jgi:uncharacterized membrane protein (DUF106 family)
MLPIAALLDVGMKVLDRFVPDPAEKAKAQAELIKMQQEGRMAEIQADTVAMQETSKRWEADMSSDSWLSKNIRPMALIAIFTAYFLFTAMSAFGYNAQESYVNLLGSWGQIVFLAYFGGRTVEKCIEMRKDATKS